MNHARTGIWSSALHLTALKTPFPQGLGVVAIRPPTAPAGVARLCATVEAAKSEDTIERPASLGRNRILS